MAVLQNKQKKFRLTEIKSLISIMLLKLFDCTVYSVNFFFLILSNIFCQTEYHTQINITINPFITRYLGILKLRYF